MEEQAQSRGSRKVKVGTVVSNKMNHTVVVKVKRTMSHPQYGKIISRSQKFYAHVDTEQNPEVGAVVQIVETRPLSRLKRWRVVGVEKQVVGA